MILEQAEQLSLVKFDAGTGLIPVVVQHAMNGEVLMHGYANRDALERCFTSGDLWLYSRSRNELWHKGGTSGNTQRFVSMSTDCDADAVLIRVDPRGPMCHTDARSCFGDPPTLRALGDTINLRMRELSAGSYTVRLMNDANLRLKKLGEEAVELAVACNQQDRERAGEEAADLIYHILVAVKAAGSSLDHVLAVLDSRHNT